MPATSDYRVARKYFLVLAIITCVNIIILFIRNKVEGNDTYNFLKFNLFLAFIPLLFATAIYFLLRKAGIIILIGASLLWLFFYPNAPYMISDLIHVNGKDQIVLYDTLIIFSFSMLALFFGFFSLKIIQLCFKERMGNKTATTLIIISIVLSSAAIYLGRILRLNSWDLFTRPLVVAKDIFDHLLPVDKNPQTYVIILLFSGIQFMFLIMMRDVELIEVPQGTVQARPVDTRSPA